MTARKGFTSYNPGIVAAASLEVLTALLQRELDSIAAALDNIGTGLFVSISYAQPDKVRALQMVYADGVTWDPGNGEGVYIRNAANTAWVFVSSLGGTVSSVGLALPAIFSVTNSPVTSTGTLTGSLTTQNTNKIFSGPPSGAAAAPTFRSLVAADLPAVTIGRHAFPVTAVAMRPSATGGCASLAQINTGSGKPDISTLDFDASTEEYAQFAIPMPKAWDEGTITASFIWSHATTTTNFGVVWGLQAVAVSDGDAIATTFGTAQTTTDTGGAADVQYKAVETSAITIAGSPAAEDIVYFRVFRKTADAGDTLAIDARLHAVVIYMNTAAETDI